MAEVENGDLEQEEEAVAVVKRGKVTIVGAGPIGTACGMTLAQKGTASEIVFLDEDGSLAHAEGLDILQGQAYTKKTDVVAGLDMGVTKNSDIIVIAFGTRMRKDMKTMEDLAEFNLQNFRRLIPELLKHSPDAIFIVTSQPNEVVCYMIWKISGISTSRIIGIGTNLATSRFRTKIRENLMANDDMVIDGYMIGECADPFPAWGSVSLNGVPFKKMNPNVGTPQDPGNWYEIINDMNKEDVWLKEKDYLNPWSIGLNVKKIIEDIFICGTTDTENELNLKRVAVHTISCFCRGFFGVNENVFLALPCYIDGAGVKGFVPLELSPDEEKAFRQAAKNAMQIQDKLLIYRK